MIGSEKEPPKLTRALSHAFLDLTAFDRKVELKVFFSTLGLQTLQAFALYLLVENTDFDASNASTKKELIITSVLSAFQLSLCIFSVYRLISNVFTLSLTKIWLIYFTAVFAFTGFYLWCAVMFDHSFHHPPWMNHESHYIEIVIAMFYYSVSNQTLTGYGDISPDHLLVELISVVQMFLGAFFMVVAIAQALPNLKTPKTRQRSSTILNRLLRRTRRFLRNWLLLFVIVINMGNGAKRDLICAFLVMSDHNDVYQENRKIDQRILAIGLTIDLIMFFLIVVSAYKYASKTTHLRTVGFWFLIQCYFATVISFANFYASEFLWDPFDRAFNYVTAHENIVQWSGHFFYFSFVTQTFVGSTVMYPRLWYAYLTCCVQMIFSVFFHVVILGLALLRLEEHQTPSFGPIQSPPDYTDGFSLEDHNYFTLHA